MNPIFRRTWLLVFLLVATLGADVAVHTRHVADRAELPSIPMFDPARVTRLRLSKGDDVTEIARADHGWRIDAPFDAAADAQVIDALVATLAAGVAMDVRVDAGNHKDYGLVAPDVIRVDLEGEAGPITSFYVGNNAAGASSFVRFAGGDDVYRARLGGRHRFDKTAGQWRDLRIESLDPDAIDIVDLGGYTLRRDGDGWRIDGRPEIQVDTADVREMVAVLAGLRAIEIVSPDHPSGLDSPLKVTLHAGDTEARLVFGRTAEGAFARADGPEVYRVPPGLVDRLDRPPEAWQDRTLVDLDLDAITRVKLVQPIVTTVVERGATGWKITRPPNVQSHPELLAQVIGFLAHFRPDTLVGDQPFTAEERFEVEADRTVVIEVGPIDGDHRLVRVGERMGRMRATVVSRLEQAFGR